eukprot:gnl/MRDRNA2_/MRDRNA2_107089_c0_seq1.p1 gnl/MRDRNA2_/MRDRNA2_107089_c0~~gnl/MRDRNA2_/MRDRNA2_107089_c0_seq1.p1  ORF type:complete len:343 (+),score=58.02 gnl/MRDRNA2_/MRDRNA2_107089_c0_seq1:39-1031(+)
MPPVGLADELLPVDDHFEAADDAGHDEDARGDTPSNGLEELLPPLHVELTQHHDGGLLLTELAGLGTYEKLISHEEIGSPESEKLLALLQEIEAKHGPEPEYRPSVKDVCQSIQEKYAKQPFRTGVVAEPHRCTPRCNPKTCERSTQLSPIPRGTVPKRVALQKKFVHHGENSWDGYWDPKAHDDIPKSVRGGAKPSAMANWHLARHHEPRFGFAHLGKPFPTGAKMTANEVLKKNRNQQSTIAPATATSQSFIQSTNSRQSKFTQEWSSAPPPKLQGSSAFVAEKPCMPVICGPIVDSHDRSKFSATPHSGAVRLPIAHWWADTENSVR